MLKKLLKYEFKATARTYGGMYLALLAASVLFGGSVRRWNGTNSDTYSTLVGCRPPCRSNQWCRW